MQFSIGKMILKKINSKTGFKNRKPVFGFQTKSRISRFSINIPSNTAFASTKVLSQASTHSEL